MLLEPSMDMDLFVNISNPEHIHLPANGTRGSGTWIAVSMPEAILTSVLLSIITVSTIVGNVLVILSVFTYKPLRIAQNFFLVSLAVADLTVAVLVMPFNVVQTLFQRWMFGLFLCEMWLTCDVLCCTASILNLCAIALDRYWAIHDPINYAHKRTLRRVVFMILIVWVVSSVICLPPLIGWNDWSRDEHSPCKLTSQQGYIVYSSCGSFFIPLMVMTTVYVKIYIATKRRLRARAKPSVIVTITRVQTSSTKFGKTPSDKALPLSAKEANHNDAIYMDDETPQDEASHVSIADQQSASEVLHLHKVDSKASENSPIHQFIEERQKISLSKERRAAQILGIVMGVFVVCWLPFFAMYVVIPFCEACSLSKKLENFITWLGYVNSTLNPIIYTIFNVDFRRAFAKLLQCNPS